MAMHLVTGYAGKAHVTAEAVGAFYAAVFGPGKYVFSIGSAFSASIISNNEVRVNDGQALINGRHCMMQSGTYESVNIANGLNGVKRNDLIALRYEKDTGTGVESVSMVVIQGTSGSNASDPVYNSGSILDGNTIVDFPLYRISIDGLSIKSITKLFDTFAPIADRPVIRSGTSDPDNSVGKDGDIYIQIV